jgi:tRNA G46 methylase TrmB
LIAPAEAVPPQSEGQRREEGVAGRALFSFVDLDGRHVVEIGCGDGRLTWHYADRAAQVTAIEPFAPALARFERN